MERGHGGATGGRHWAGGLHSCRLLLLVGTAANKEDNITHEPLDASAMGGLIPSGLTEYVSFG